jgi:hypothetical protein
MHLILPFAAAQSDTGRHALQTLRLPQLNALLPRLTATRRDDGDELSLTTPHERALARAIGLAGDDGRLPWAALAAARDGIAIDALAWGLLTPVHWHVGTDQVSLADPQSLALSEAESHELLDALRPLFEEEGFALAYGAPTRWYAAHESLAALPTASLDRVIGRNIDRWLPGSHDARLIRRLQSEAQMLLHRHPINEEREAHRELPVNSFWLSGCGRRQPAASTAGLLIDHRLRAPLLGENWADWTEAWRALDAGPVRELLARHDAGEAVSLTLCGERFAQRLQAGSQGWLTRLARRFGGASPTALLEAL